MKYVQTISGTATGTTEVVAIDTDSRDFTQRAEWVAAQVNAKKWRVIPSFIAGAIDGVNRLVASVEFQLSDQQSLEFDAYLMFRNPETTAREIILYANLPIDGTTLKFTDPDTPPVALKDWEVPGALIGPPLLSQPGHYQFRWNASIGDVWTGASGTTYKLVALGSGLFGRSYAWMAVQR